MNCAIGLPPLYSVQRHTDSLTVMDTLGPVWEIVIINRFNLSPKNLTELNLRLLMSYIYIYIYMEHLFLMFLDHTQRRSTVGRSPLDE